MNSFSYIIGIAMVSVVIYYGLNVWKAREQESYRNKIRRGFETLDEIKEHAKEFNEKSIIKVADTIYVAIGYALANSIMIIGHDGVVIVDVTESYESAKEIFAEFRKITNKPVTDIIYTHNHADHTYGAKAFVEDEQFRPNIWAHKSILKALAMNFNGPNIAHYVRAMRQFGVFLPEVSAGIGFKLNIGKEGMTSGFLYPNKFVDGEELDIKMAGVSLKIVHIPGETDDQIGVWIPDQSAFLCADDLYKAFPNLYAIRGTKSRELMQWVNSLDKMIDLEPDKLVPSHTRPIFGRETVSELLTEYRDAIQYVHDQSVRLINYGYHPDEIGNMVQLPKHLLKNPFLKEFYGTIKWSAKSVFTDYEGWFSGDPVDLDPLTRNEKAQKMVNLVGAEKLVNTAKEALNSREFQWALELSSYIVRVDPNNKAAKDVKVEALTALGSRQTSVNGRNYYLTSALEEATGLEYKTPKETREALVREFPIDYVISAFSVLFRPEDCADRNETLYIELSEPSSHHFIKLRNGVARVRHKTPRQWDIKLKTTETIWKDIILKERNTLAAIAIGDILIEGGTLALNSFMSCFDRDITFVV
ncbi:linear primary-alkylsulfatase-like [Ruditapes philippinarum]|uniref:linear primary-alkylsulfatase-like n=1 Tax=Ruditapes philippinarum TaxID=129788 RepID=UPI00295A59F3|nr:linear primary-alkylsulfatase-like [Ruditapes philippinarum]